MVEDSLVVVKLSCFIVEDSLLVGCQYNSYGILTRKN